MPNLQGKIELIKQAQVDIKNAIIDKGVTPTGNISTYADAIDNIVTPNNQTKTVTENGVVRYDTGYTGLEQVTVNVNQSVQNKNITTNGTYTADSGYVGLGVVTVDVSPDVIAKTITANGTYNAEDDDVEGYSSVTVNVPSPIDDLIDGSITEVDTNVSTIKGGAFKDCEDLDTIVLRSNTVVDLSDDRFFENTPIVSGEGNIYVPDRLVEEYLRPQNWNISSQASSSPQDWRSICAFSDGGGGIIALSEGGRTKILQNNSTTWVSGGTLPTTGEMYGWQTIYYLSSTHALHAISYEGYTSYSYDNGATWSNATIIQEIRGGSWRACCLDDNENVVFVSQFGSAAKYDGSNWSYGSLGNIGDAGWFDLTFDGSKFIAISDDGYISTSTNGTTWTQPTQNNTLKYSNCRGIIYKNGLYVVLGNFGKILISTDYTNFTLDTTLSNFMGYAITYNKNNIFALDRAGIVMNAYSLPYNVLPISQLPSS